MKKLYYLTFIFFYSCNFVIEKTSFQDPNLPDYFLEIYDTIKVETLGTANIFDYKENKSLAYDWLSSSIYVLDNKGQILHTLKREIDDNVGYGVRFGGGGFLTDSTFVIIGLKGYYIYNFKGELLKKGPHFKGDANIPINLKDNIVKFNNENGDELIAYAKWDANASIFNPSFFKDLKLLNVANLNSEENLPALKIPSESIYHNGKTLFSEVSPLFEFNTNTNLLIVLFPLDKNLYFFNYKFGKFELVEKIATSPANYSSPTGFLYNSNEVQAGNLGVKGRINNLKTFRFTNLFAHDDFYYLEYKPEIDEDINEEHDLIKNYNNTFHKYHKRYLHIYKGGKKFCKDVLLPEKVYGIERIISNEKILLVEISTLEELDYQRKLVARLKKMEK
jgi:hypothetical protein